MRFVLFRLLLSLSIWTFTFVCHYHAFEKVVSKKILLRLLDCVLIFFFH